jgi:hypothetical protein
VNVDAARAAVGGKVRKASGRKARKASSKAQDAAQDAQYGGAA